MGRLIDADRLKAHYCWWAGGSKEMSIDEAKRDFDAIIGVQPTVDAIPLEDYQSMERTVNKLRVALAYAELVRHGHWMPYEFATNNRWRKCSVCGTADEYINEYGIEAIRKYCPYCGAKMDEVEDAEHS